MAVPNSTIRPRSGKESPGENLSLFRGKHCPSCLRFLLFTEFHKNRRSKDGRGSSCKECVKRRTQGDNPPRDATNKKCPRCGLVKPLAEFGLRVNGRWRRSHCHHCSSEMATSWYFRNKEKARVKNRATTLRRYYGLTPEDYDEMMARQNGVCAICGDVERTLRKTKLCVDHDHATGAIRGLLCTRCNTAMGFFRNSPEIAAKMVTYLREHAEKPTEEIRFVHRPVPYRKRP